MLLRNRRHGGMPVGMSAMSLDLFPDDGKLDSISFMKRSKSEVDGNDAITSSWRTATAAVTAATVC